MKPARRKPGKDRRKAAGRLSWAPLKPWRPATRWEWCRGMLLRAAGAAALMGLLTGLVLLFVYGRMAREYDLAQLGQMPERTVVVDSKGQVLGRLHGEDRIVVSLAEVSPWFVKALLAREDTRFYRHSGIDYIGVARAMLRNLKDGRIVQGASTLTMQLARNSYPDLDERSFHRKLLEVMLARRIEKALTKDQILEHYVNRIFFGPGLWGIQRASQVYFGKHASQLSLSEAALIAGIIRSPSRFSPFRNFESAVRERDSVLKRMVAVRAITPEEEIAARYEEVILQAPPVFQSQGGYALDAVRRELDLILEEKEMREGGLRVITTLDRDLTTAAEEALERRLREVEKTPGYRHPVKSAYDQQWNQVNSVLETPYLQGAVAVINNETGGVLALVGGRDYRQSKFNRATQGSRQLGSTVKPFVYAAGIQAGLLPGTLVSDDPLQPGEIAGADPAWNPGNADGRSTGLQPVATGLVQSRNLISIRVGHHAGLEKVTQTLAEAGLGNGQQTSAQAYIGNLSGNAYQLAVAYTLFPNGGQRLRPHLIDKIVDKKGRILFRTGVMEVEAMAPGVAHVIHRMLKQALARGESGALRSLEGSQSAFGGKTGTTNQYRDAWFAGYTGRITAAVWIGMDQAAKIVEDGYGARLALPLWEDIVKRSVDMGYKTTAAKPLPPLSQVALCRFSSALASHGCQDKGCAYEDMLPYELVPGEFCRMHGVAGSAPSPQPPSFWQRVRKWFD